MKLQTYREQLQKLLARQRHQIRPSLLRQFRCPALKRRRPNRRLRLHLLALGLLAVALLNADPTVPAAVLVMDHNVLDPRVVAHLVPAVVAAVAEDHLVVCWALHAGAFLAERLLGSALPVMGSLSGARFHGGRVVGGRLQHLAARLRHSARCCWC